MTICEEIMIEEEQTLAEYAMKTKDSKGRSEYEAEDSLRTAFMRDRDRIIHSKAFRRLKHKTQVYVSPESDHYRTRLTHTLEVNQIAKTIGRALKLNLDLIEAIALAHDVGHTPFAHCGEEVLNERMSAGFKHNLNSIRVLKKIEEHGSKRGLNLSWEVLDGVVHHSGFTKEVRHANTIEGQLIRYADKIAYVQHDIDDSIRAGLLKEGDLPREYTDILGNTTSKRITTLVTDLVMQGKNLDNDPNMKLSFSGHVDNALRGLRAFLFSEIYHGKVCIQERERSSYIVGYLFDYFIKDQSRMPIFYQELAYRDGLEQGVCDYISGMTDNFCISLFKDLAIPRSFINKNYNA